MAKGNFTVYLVTSPKDRNPKNIGNVEGENEVQVMAQAIALAKRKFARKEVQGCGIEAIEYGGERRQYAGVIY